MSKGTMNNLNEIKDHFETTFRRKDPWDYSSEYEVEKRSHLLELLVNSQSSSALEIGCAEGELTSELSRQVDHLTAVDISERALSRAKERCKNLPNVSFISADVFANFPEGLFDLIICSEILYYSKNIFDLSKFRDELIEHLEVGGSVILAHALAVADNKESTGFDFNEMGSDTISKVFGKSRVLRFERELRTEVYRMQVFRKVARGDIASFFPFRIQTPDEVLVRTAQLPGDSSQIGQIKWGGCIVSASEARFLWTSPNIPILAYHRIADTGPEALRPYRLSKESFERQLAYLQRHGYRSIDLNSAFSYIKNSKKPPGRLISITFDDAYEDFFSFGLPLLKKYGFSATVFVPVGYVGKTAEWDITYGEPAAIMDWSQIREAARQGMIFGSHTMTHPRLTEIDPEAALFELKRSRDVLSENIGKKVSDFCYPFGKVSQQIQKLAEEVGYRFACSGRGLLKSDVNRWRMPRQEIFESEGMLGFVEKLGSPELASLKSRAKFRLLHSIRSRLTYTSF